MKIFWRLHIERSKLLEIPNRVRKIRQQAELEIVLKSILIEFTPEIV